MDDLGGPVRDFLRPRQPGFDCLILDVPVYDDFVQAVGRDWDGGVPAVLIYDRSGELRHELVGEKPEDEVEKALRELLRESAEK
jgi:hypothetical protein